MLLAGALVADAATFAVNSTVDAGDAAPGDGACETVSGAGTCTLRAAIEESNAIAGADVVNVPPGVYALVVDPLVVNDDLTLIGAGAVATIVDGGGGISVGVATVDIHGVTVRNSNTNSGGVYNEGTLTLTDSVVSGNFGGISNNATLTVERVTIRGNSNGLAGGIVSSGSLVVIDSTIAENSGTIGGGVLALWGTATLSNTTVSGNSAVYGGGISAGLCAFGCTIADVLLNNVTITNNSVSTGEGGGVAVFSGGDGSSTLRMRNTVIAGNSAQAAPSQDCAPAVISEGYNLIGNAAGCVVLGDTTGNLIGVSAKLGLLQSNGGPTPTHAPLAGSPLIDAGNPVAPGSGSPACEAADQRGVARPQGVGCDIGAVEAGGVAPTTTTVTTTSTTTSTTLPPPFCAPTPRDDCMAALSGKSSVLLKEGSTDTRDASTWKWRSSGFVAKADFGSPITTTDLAICIYDATAGQMLRLEAAAPAGGVCAGRSCWKESSSGFRYADRDLTPNGLATVRLKAGGPGAGRITIKGRGPILVLPGMPLTAPVIVQLQRRDGAPCWGATFSAPDTDTSVAFRAKAD